MAGPLTVYSNIVNVKVSANELVFEFGAVFPETPRTSIQKAFEPEVRIVLSSVALNSFLQVLQQAAAQVAKQKQATSPQSEPARTASKQ